jgi:hypothetical protein
MLRAEKCAAGAIDFTANPALKGLSPLEVFDAVVDALGNAHVAVSCSPPSPPSISFNFFFRSFSFSRPAPSCKVVLNNHTTMGMWSGSVEANGL